MDNEKLFEGAVALVTGANKGIGLETARGLGRENIIVLVGARDESRGQAAAAQLRREGIDARFVQIDVANPETIRSAARWIEDEFGHLDILVNNAGIAEWGMRPSETDPEKLREIYETNFFGPVTAIQAMLPLLRKSKRGRIVNVSSSLGSLKMASDPASPMSQARGLAYCTSKTALNSMTVQFANELRDTPIKVNAVCPGYCATDINNHSGPRTAAQGAVASVRYATLGDDGPTAGYFDENGPVPW